MAKGPQFTRYILPILHALREMGGSATAAEVTDAVIEREDLPEARGCCGVLCAKAGAQPRLNLLRGVARLPR